jgi:hypothetical protein
MSRKARCSRSRPTIIEGFSSAFQHTAPDAATPDLNTPGKSLDGLVSASVPVNGRTLQLSYARGEDAVSALFMADGVYNEYLVDPALGAGTDWVVAFPTKRFYADPARVGTAARAPFDALFGANTALPGTSCSTVSAQVVSREEDVPVSGIFDPPPVPAHASVCFETSVLTLAGAVSTLGSRLLVATDAATSTIPDVRYRGGQILLDLSGPAHALVSSNGDALLGLPAIGFAVTNYVNANVAPGVLSNYSAAYPHRPAAACTDSLGRSCAGGTAGAVTFSPLNPAPAPLTISPNPINAGTGAGSTATVRYSAVYASACSVLEQRRHAVADRQRRLPCGFARQHFLFRQRRAAQLFRERDRRGTNAAVRPQFLQLYADDYLQSWRRYELGQPERGSGWRRWRQHSGRMPEPRCDRNRHGGPVLVAGLDDQGQVRRRHNRVRRRRDKLRGSVELSGRNRAMARQCRLTTRPRLWSIST